MTNDSVLGRLLAEVSWEKASRYHNGGLGFENVLTAEALQGLDFLPRQQFFGAVVQAIHGLGADVDVVKERLFREAEEASFRLLPSQSYYLRPSAEALNVQPDAIIETPGVFVLVEAKRIKSSCFQAGQLAKEYVLALREARERLPLLLLILGQEPPVRVQGRGRMDVAEAVLQDLNAVYERTEGLVVGPDGLAERIRSSVAWITWKEIAEAIDAAKCRFDGESALVRACVERIAKSVVEAVQRHG
jgi:hypothetical protein